MSIWYVSSKIGNSGNSGSDPGNPSNDLDLVVGKAADGDEIVIVDEYVADTKVLDSTTGILALIPANKTLYISGKKPYSIIEANGIVNHSNGFFGSASLTTSASLIFKNLLFSMKTNSFKAYSPNILSGNGGSLVGVTATFHNCLFTNNNGTQMTLTYEQSDGGSTFYFNNCSFLSNIVLEGYPSSITRKMYFDNCLCSGTFTKYFGTRTNCYENVEFDENYRALNYDNNLYGVYSGEYAWTLDKQFLEINNNYYTIQEENNND